MLEYRHHTGFNYWPIPSGGVGFLRLMAKYDNINFQPTEAMANEAQRGLDWRSEFGRGGTAVGIARGRQLVNRQNLSPDTVKRMFSFFSRHEVDKQAQGFSPGEDGYPSNGRIAWALWGGDAGFSWSRNIVRRMDAADKVDKAIEQLKALVDDK